MYGVQIRAYVRTAGRLSSLGTLPEATTVQHSISTTGAMWLGNPTRPPLSARSFGMRQEECRPGTLPGDTGSRAFGINDSDQVVGYSSGPNGVTAFVWKKSTGMTSLGTLPGGNTSEAYDINNAGAVVGVSSTSSGEKHGFLWASGNGMQDLGILKGNNASEAHKINNQGDVVGVSSGSNVTHAFLWKSSGGMQDLGTLGGDFSDALDLNNNGEVVGTSTDSHGARAFHWSSNSGMQDLNALIPANSNVVLTSAISINSAGLIVAVGAVTADVSNPLETDDTHRHAGPIHAFLLTPFH